MAQHDSTLFNKWDNVVSSVRNEIVFESRNKEYGAYQIRREYNRVLVLALLSTCTAILLIAITPKIIELIKNTSQEVVVPVDITPVDLTAPPPIDETEPPPPPPPPPPVMETVKFTPPVVVDEEVVDDPPPPQETEVQVSTVTQEGTDGDIIIPDEKGTGVVEAVAEEVFTVVEQMPEFPGGMAEMYKFINKNMQYPQIEKENGISGTVYVTFVVDKAGNINDVKTLRGVAGGPNLEKEALRVVKMMPAWKSGKQNGREVSVQFNLPIKFVLK